ncbi:SDR family oxidoreductase [Marinobacter sp.]|uniref:SDR family oxidoreductase n=1 Tax=Marinobacter sp. TaxID=50741 RepID=UPI00199A06ED|nr:SDR family oxidoreductase [Marinobacter sp.]MBD3657565.1 SDR family oxidoreductase [Marinobacter sp.]
MRKNLLITGASSGLGEGMAREFAKRGCNLALCARRTDQLDALKAELENRYPQIRVCVRPLDVCNHEQVFEVFRAFRDDLGGLDRVIVNAGIGKGAPIGTGNFDANRQTAETNFVAALAQCEAAMEIFRQQNSGHLVAISSVSAVRGFRGAMSVYAASKAGLANLAEGIRMDVMNTPIKVSTLFPGYILTDINREVRNAPFRVDLETGCRALVAAIEKEPAEAFVPGWPWTPLGFLLKRLPVGMVARLS